MVEASFPVRALALTEAYAEKFRAAMTRREPAVRDFFDLAYAVRDMALNTQDAAFISMVAAKLAVAGNAPVDVSARRKQELHQQLEGRLRPVLRPAHFAAFDLQAAFELVRRVAEIVEVYQSDALPQFLPDLESQNSHYETDDARCPQRQKDGVVKRLPCYSCLSGRFSDLPSGFSSRAYF